MFPDGNQFDWGSVLATGGALLSDLLGGSGTGFYPPSGPTPIAPGSTNETITPSSPMSISALAVVGIVAALFLMKK